MVNFTAWMLRDKNTGRWHNWGGLTEWYPPTDRGGTLWFDFDKAKEFAEEYNSKKIGVVVEVVPIQCHEVPKHTWPDSWEIAKDGKWSGVMPNDAATEFALFDNGEIVRKLSKAEAIELFPEVRLFPI